MAGGEAGGARAAGLGGEPQEAEAVDAEHGLNARSRRRYVTTTDSDHNQPIFPNRTKDLILDGPDQLWIADMTYVAVAVGFVYVALIMDAWSRRIVGYALSRRIDARLTLAALDAAIALRQPPPGCVHHGDRGSQYAAEKYRDRLRDSSSARWAGAAILTTTRRWRAS